MKKLLLILLSALSLTAFAEEKNTIRIQEPKCDNPAIASMIQNALTMAFIEDENWQPLERPSNEELNMRYLAGESIGNIRAAQYVLATEIVGMDGAYYISCHILDVETGQIIRMASEFSDASSMQSIQQAGVSLAKQLLKN